MKKLLFLATALCLAASAVAAEQGGKIKQTTIRYNAPTCENCKTTSYEETIYPSRPARPVQPACSSCAAPAPAPAPCAAPRACVENSELGIANPLFFVKPGQFSSETIGSLWKQPKNKKKDTGESRGYDVAERIYFGLYDRLALHLEGGYAFQAPKTKQYKAFEGAPVPHYSSYDGTVGLTYHLIDTCPFDLMVGVDGTWGRARFKQGDVKDGHNFAFVTPTATAGFTFTPFKTHDGRTDRYFTISPYIKAAYSFDVADSKYEDDFYHFGPGLYIQPSKYYAFDIYAEKVEHEKWQYNAGLDLYPYKNLAVGFNLHAKQPLDDPMYIYGIAGHIKFVF